MVLLFVSKYVSVLEDIDIFFEIFTWSDVNFHKHFYEHFIISYQINKIIFYNCYVYNIHYYFEN